MENKYNNKKNKNILRNLPIKLLFEIFRAANISNEKTTFNKVSVIEKKLKKYSIKLISSTTIIFINFKKWTRKFLIIYVLAGIILKKLFNEIKRRMSYIVRFCTICMQPIRKNAPLNSSTCDNCSWDVKKAALNAKAATSSYMAKSNSSKDDLIKKTCAQEANIAEDDARNEDLVSWSPFSACDKPWPVDYALQNTLAEVGVSQITVSQNPIVFSRVVVPVHYDFVHIGFGLGFTPSKRITIVGTPLSQPRHFIINMGEVNVLNFSFNTRFHQNIVARNTWKANEGSGTEEIFGGFPFAVGQSFVLEFFAEANNTVKVDVNYKPFITFCRFDLSKVSHLEITGDVQIGSVVFCKY